MLSPYVCTGRAIFARESCLQTPFAVAAAAAKIPYSTAQHGRDTNFLPNHNRNVIDAALLIASI